MHKKGLVQNTYKGLIRHRNSIASNKSTAEFSFNMGSPLKVAKKKDCTAANTVLLQVGLDAVNFRFAIRCACKNYG